MYINKQFILIVSIVAALLFNSAHADVLYTESGSDGLGNSFNITFDWNSSTTSIDSVISASFTDSLLTFDGKKVVGFYELTNFKVTQNPVITDWADWKANHDWIAYDISTGDPRSLDISIGLTMTTVPTPAPILNYALTPYALTYDGNNAGCCFASYFNPSLISISPVFSSVPLPPSIWLFGSALAYFGLLGQRRREPA